MPSIHPRPFHSLRKVFDRAEAARERGLDKAEIKDVLAREYEQFIRRGWARPSWYVREGFYALPDHEQSLVREAFLCVVRPLRPALAASLDGELEVGERGRILTESVARGVVWGLETVVALRMMGASEQAIEVAGSGLTELIQGALLVSEADRLASEEGRAAREVGPEAITAVGLGSQPSDDQAIFGSRDLAFTLNRRIWASATRMREAMDDYGALAIGALPLESADPEWLSGLRETVGSVALSLGGGRQGQVEGALALIDAVMDRVAPDSGPADARKRRAALGRALTALREISNLGREARTVEETLNGFWGPVDREVRIAARAGGIQPVPLPDNATPLISRAMFVQEAARLGRPLGLLLAEIYDSRRLYFTEDERRFLERVAVRAALAYAEALEADQPHLAKVVGGDGEKARELQSALRPIEIEARRLPEGEDIEDFVSGRAEAMCGQETPWVDPEALGPTIERIVDRAVAGQEVRHLVSAIAVNGRLPQELVARYRALPHTSRRLSSRTKGSMSRRTRARNGQPLVDLDADTRDEWERHQVGAPTARDGTGVRARDFQAPGPTTQPPSPRVERPDRQHKRQRAR